MSMAAQSAPTLPTTRRYYVMLLIRFRRASITVLLALALASTAAHGDAGVDVSYVPVGTHGAEYEVGLWQGMSSGMGTF